MPRRIETLFIQGPAGKLEALLEEPEDREPEFAALVCHPHPLHGGTMHNKVVHRIARGLRRAGGVVMRFNFRGVNLSEGFHDNGAGEVSDASAALAVLRERYPTLPFTLAGFSFGSRVTLRLAQLEPSAKRAIAVGFPGHYLGNTALVQCPVPRVFIHSRNDTVCRPEHLLEFIAFLAEPVRLEWIDAQDHFFAGGLEQLEELVASLARE